MPNIVERQGNTPEQIREYLRTALEILESENVPEDLRPFAFSKLVDLAAAKTMIQELTPIERAMLGNG